MDAIPCPVFQMNSKKIQCPHSVFSVTSLSSPCARRMISSLGPSKTAILLFLLSLFSQSIVLVSSLLPWNNLGPVLSLMPSTLSKPWI